ncbi:Fur family transcriptional regulator [Nocardia pseudovaccinii]|uniref:Fur family transcriptional regulator n=1 Tax=Nocardia pseudovaccinii TaxID=189540 RepID=UPI0007C72049|nr:Fur family transcriptional regulator [Nocardia pseudovaccinii]
MSQPDRRSAERTVARRHRVTLRQRVVLDALRRGDRFRSAQQLHTDLRLTSTIGIGLTSVYRILHRLADQQLVETQHAEDGELLYRIRDSCGHHHYLMCRICGRAEQFTLDAVEQHADLIASQHRYRDVSHRLDLYGICPRCATEPEITAQCRTDANR